MSKIEIGLNIFDPNRQKTQKGQSKIPNQQVNKNNSQNKQEPEGQNNENKNSEYGKTKFQKIFDFFNQRAIKNNEEQKLMQSKTRVCCSTKTKSTSNAEKKSQRNCENKGEEKVKISLENSTKKDEKMNNILGNNENKTKEEQKNSLSNSVNTIKEQHQMTPKNSKIKTEEITKNCPINIINIINKELKKSPRTSINKADGVDNKIEKKSENITNEELLKNAEKNINKINKKPNPQSNSLEAKEDKSQTTQKNNLNKKNDIPNIIFNKIENAPKSTKENEANTDEEPKNYYEFENISKLVTSFKPFYTIEADFEKNFINFFIILHDNRIDSSKINASLQIINNGYNIRIEGETSNIDELYINESTIESGFFFIEEVIPLIPNAELKKNWRLDKKINEEGNAIILFSIDE